MSPSARQSAGAACGCTVKAIRARASSRRQPTASQTMSVTFSLPPSPPSRHHRARPGFPRPASELRSPAPGPPLGSAECSNLWSSTTAATFPSARAVVSNALSRSRSCSLLAAVPEHHAIAFASNCRAAAPAACTPSGPYGATACRCTLRCPRPAAASASATFEPHPIGVSTAPKHDAVPAMTDTEAEPCRYSVSKGASRTTSSLSAPVSAMVFSL
ncbi:hypothetical protein T484DRAFT_1955847 [Baffinella frigidus]|nr:hypothetical protein T484DRAFT_1955847 [Cryptophyta sp. CCMP2293]